MANKDNARHDDGSPNAKRWRQTTGSHGCLMLLGLPFLALGAYMSIGPMVSAADSPPLLASIMLASVCLLLIAAGSWMIFQRTGLEIDPQSRTVAQWWGLFVPMRRFEQKLSEFEEVALGEEHRGGHRGSRKVFAVRLAGDAQGLLLGDFEDYLDARRVAEEVAGLCRLRLHDDTSGEPSLREHDELQLSLRERRRKAGKALAPARRPKSLIAQVAARDDRVSITLPPGFHLRVGAVYRSSNLANIAFFVAGSQLGCLIMYLVFGRLPSREAPAETVASLVAGFMTLVALLALARWVIRRFLTGPVEIVATQDQLSFQWRGLWGARVIEIPSNELEELLLSKPTRLSGMSDVAPVFRGVVQQLGDSGCAITARSDAASVTFGAGMPFNELRYLHNAMLRTLANEPERQST